MEAIVKKFLSENPIDDAKPIIILIGEHHGGDGDEEELYENVGKQDIIFKTLQEAGEVETAVYSELSSEDIFKVDDTMTVYYTQKLAKKYGFHFRESIVTGEARKGNVFSCNDIYSKDIESQFYFGPDVKTPSARNGGGAAGGEAGGEEATAGAKNANKPIITCVIAVIGLLHLPYLIFNEDEYAVLSLNCTSSTTTWRVIQELKSLKKEEEIIDFFEDTWIEDSEAIDNGKNIIFESLDGKNISRSKSTKKWKPTWVKNRFGDWVMECDECKMRSGIDYNDMAHIDTCSRHFLSPNISEKPANNGEEKGGEEKGGEENAGGENAGGENAGEENAGGENAGNGAKGGKRKRTRRRQQLKRHGKKFETRKRRK